MSRKMVIMAGGTGGHVFPGLAVAHRLQADGWQIHWLGTPDRMEADLVPAHGFPIEFINIRGLRNHGLVRKLSAPFQIMKAILQAFMILRRIKPDVVLGMGGYVTGPGGLAASATLYPRHGLALSRLAALVAHAVARPCPVALCGGGARLAGGGFQRVLVYLGGDVARQFSAGQRRGWRLWRGRRRRRIGRSAGWPSGRPTRPRRRHPRRRGAEHAGLCPADRQLAVGAAQLATGHAGHRCADACSGRDAGPAAAAGRGALHPHHPAPLRPQGAEQCGLCLPDRRLHRQRSFCSESASLLRGVHRRLFGLQRRLRAAHEAGPLSGRPEHQERRQG